MYEVMVTCEICRQKFIAQSSESNPIDSGWYHDECMQEATKYVHEFEDDFLD